MLQRSLTTVGRFAGAVLALAALVVAGPAVLVAVARQRFKSANPLHQIPWPWQWDFGQIVEALQSQLTNDVVINLLIRTSLSVVWAAVAIIVATTVVETVHLVRHRGLTLPRIRGLGWAQPTARFIAAGLVALLPLTTPATALVSAGSSPMPWSPSPAATEQVDAGSSGNGVNADQHDARHDQASATDRPAAASLKQSRLHLVQRGESIYAIAEWLSANVAMSTVDIADSILDANLGSVMPGGSRFTNAAYIEAGWELVLPAEVLPLAFVVPSTPITMQLDGSTASPADIAAGSHAVVEGDTLSDIAAERLGDAAAWPDIFEESRGRDMGDGRTFDDPNLIVPGWELDLPTEPDVESVDDLPEPSVVTAPPSSNTSPATTGVRDPAPPAVPAVTSAATPTTATTGTTTTPFVSDGNGPPGDIEAPSSPRAPSPIRIEYAPLLAACVLALVAVRRRERLRGAAPRTRVPEPPPSVVTTERRLRSIDAGERSTRIDVAIRAAAQSLIDTDAQIGVLLVDQDGGVELRLTAAAELGAPWSLVGNDGQSWLLPASVPVELLSAEARRVATPCVALVQVGIADDRDVFVDIEACGTFLVEAQLDQADEIVTAIAAGLAASPYAEVAQLISVSLPPAALLAHRNAHHATSVGAAFDLAASLVGSTISNERSSFSLRSLRTGGEMWEPAVLLLTSTDQADLQTVSTAFPPGGHGVGIVATTDPEANIDAGGRIRASADEWTLDAFGLSFALDPVGMSLDDLTALTDLLDDAVEPVIDADPADEPGVCEIAELAPQSNATAEPPIKTLAAKTPAVELFIPREHSIIVRLMGGVDVIDLDGIPGKFERSKTVELIAWLATHREKSTRTAARTALWELDVRDATFANVVSEARRALGRLVVPDGDDEWLARTLTEQLPLHGAVVTDSDLVQERLDAARLQAPAHAIDTLRPAAEMIRDMPFAGTSYLWPDAEGITSNLILLATGVATELAGHALSLGDIDLVFWATGRGLTVLPGHEELIGLRMRAHARAGDLAGVRQEWESYERVIVADAWSDGEPAPKLLALRRELLSTPA
jgi:nucleoid-associated protein YgaU